MTDSAALVLGSPRSESPFGDKDPRGTVLSIAYRASDCMRCLPTALIHFFVVESRTLWMVWLTGYLTAIGREKFEPEQLHHATWKFETCPGKLNYTVLCYVVAFILVNTCSLVARCGVCASFEDGKYLAFTFDLALSRRYRIMSYLLIVLIWAVFIFAMTISGSWWAFLTTFGANFLAVFFLSTELLGKECKRFKDQSCVVSSTKTPAIDWSTDAFQNIKFSRTICALFSQTNDAFALKLTKACWKATGETYKSLWNCVSDECLENSLEIKPFD